MYIFCTHIKQSNSTNINRKKRYLASYKIPFILYLFLIYYALDSTISLIPVLSSPSTSTSAKAGIHTKSTPDGATKPLAVATAYTA